VEPGEGGLIKGRKRSRQDARDDALGRLSTRPERGGKPGFGGRGDKPGFGGRGDKPGFGGKRFDGPRDKPEDKPRPGQRKSNVWMAPGARPQNEGKAAAKDKPSSKGGSRPSSAGRPSSPRDGGGGKGPRGPRKG
jgi:23S rRNA pseudouridine2605 synthase